MSQTIIRKEKHHVWFGENLSILGHSRVERGRSTYVEIGRQGNVREIIAYVPAEYLVDRTTDVNLNHVPVEHFVGRIRGVNPIPMFHRNISSVEHES